MNPINTIRCACLALCLIWVGAETFAVELRWLGEAPKTAEVVSWGTPWAPGAMKKGEGAGLKDAAGKTIAVQTWPLAYWPDGSVKWSGHAAVTAAGQAGPFRLTAGSAGEVPAAALRASEDNGLITIDTGAVVARIGTGGAALIQSLEVDGRTVAADGKLIAMAEDRSQLEASGTIRQINFESKIEKATLEQSGPVRATVKLEGKHRAVAGIEREWLPFVVRLYFFAGTGEIRIVHSFIFDGADQQDYIKGIGMQFSVPFREETQNRHIRFVGDGGGAWVQPVALLPGYRPSANIDEAMYQAQLEGKSVGNMADFPENQRRAILTVPEWGDAKLTQLGPNNWSISKRTTAKSGWLHVTDGKHSKGLALFGDATGGIAVGVKHFWEKAPRSFELTGGREAAGTFKVWFWSPAGEAMDLRTYDTEMGHDLSINYEDWKQGWNTPEGIANTQDLTLWAFGAMPSNSDLDAMATQATETPLLVCTPEYYHATPVFGKWSLPDRSTPATRWIEDRVLGLFEYYRDQVAERSWYGFWDFGDLMHNYDFGRHEWRYDVGGWAWINSELMPDMFLYMTFLRTGRADAFRMAEAMTRHTAEVDVHHLGRFAPLGTRHNVNHWGDGAKQPRISYAGIKLWHYYLTADERTGDLLREQLTAQEAYDRVRAMDVSRSGGAGERSGRAGNPPANRGGGRRGGRRGNNATTGTQIADAGTSGTQRGGGRRGGGRGGNQGNGIAFGLDWICYFTNWAVEWERTQDPAARAKLEAMMASVAPADANGTLRGGGYFDMIFGGVESLSIMEPSFADAAMFWRGWANSAAAQGPPMGGNNMTGPRLTAYAAMKKNDAALGIYAWRQLIGDQPLSDAAEPYAPKKVALPTLVDPVTDPYFLGERVGWQLHGPASIQWALNAIETLEMAKPWLADWEKGAASGTWPAAPASAQGQ